MQREEVAKLIVAEIERQSDGDSDPMSVGCHIADGFGLDQVCIDGYVNLLKVADKLIEALAPTERADAPVVIDYEQKKVTF